MTRDLASDSCDETAIDNSPLLPPEVECSASTEVIDRILKDLPSEAVAGQAESCPVWMLRSEQESLGMRHQPEDSSRWVAQSGNVARRTVRVSRVTFVRGMSPFCSVGR